MLSFKSINTLSWFFIGLVISACAHVTAPEDVASEVEGLTQAISALSSEVSPTDASQTSSLLIHTAIELADEYNMASPGLYHNMLVNMGLRERGLCLSLGRGFAYKIARVGHKFIKI